MTQKREETPTREQRGFPPERFLLDLCPELPQKTLQERWEHVNTVLRVSMMSGLQMQLEATLKLLCDSCAEIVAFETGLAYFWNAKSEQSELRSVCRRPGNAAESPVAPSGYESNVLDLWCRIHRRPVRVRLGDHEAADSVLSTCGGKVALALPLFVNGRVMGSLQLISADENAFTLEDAQLLWVLVHVAENLLTREHANESLMMFAFTDHLTGLRTRGYFEQQLELELKRSERKGEPLVLLMLDIDNFKILNDTYGHSIGDQVLREVSEVLSQDMREVDTLARFGGEEFVIILPDTTEAEGLAVAERIRQAVAGTTFLRGPGLAGFAPLSLSISIGVSTFPAETADKNELVEFADVALYAAKAQGRNRVVLHRQLASAQREAI